MASISLINPYFEGYVSIPTLGLGYLAGYISQNSDHEVRVVEPLLENISRERVIEELHNINFVALTCYTENRFQCFDLADDIRANNPNVVIIIGGPHASIFPKEILEHNMSIDYVVRLEGELTLLELINGQDISSIDGLTYRSGSQILSNPDRKPIDDLSVTHFPYSSFASILDGWKDYEVPFDLLKLKHIPIMASRGCPFKCAFCCANDLGYKQWRGIDPIRIVKEMHELYLDHTIQYFRFYDPLFYPDKQSLELFCDELEKLQLPIYFRIDIRAGTSPALLKRLYSVGCRVVGFGVESGSDRMLKYLNKKTSRSIIEDTIASCRKIGLWTIGFFMTSMPEETVSERISTSKLYHEFDVFNLQFFMIQPGTMIYDEMKAKNELDDTIWFDKKYDTNIYYCAENFKSSTVFSDDVKRYIRTSYYSFNAKNPGKVIKRRGLVTGLVTVTVSAMLLLISHTPLVSVIYDGFRKSQYFKAIKNQFIARGVQVYG